MGNGREIENEPLSGLRVISFGLWGSDEKYTAGAEANVALARDFYPGWQCWFWADRSVPADVIRLLETQPNCRVIVGDNLQNLGHRILWRFLTAADPSVAVMIVRDADSRIDEREALAVAEWLDSGRAFHIMRDHRDHRVPMCGGMWGTHCSAMRDVESRIFNYYLNGAPYAGDLGFDQGFLADQVWPQASRDCLVHDPHFGGRPFPDGSLEQTHHVGQVHSPNDEDWDAMTPRLAAEVPSNGEERGSAPRK